MRRRQLDAVPFRIADARDAVARPVLSSASTTTPFSRGLPVAGSNRDGIALRNRASDGSVSMPMIESCGPVMPASVRYAVPFGRIRSSAVCTCVCVPKTAVTLPSRCQPIAIFSLVASAWKSTMMTRVRCRIASISRSTTGERVVDVEHEHAAHDVDDADGAAVAASAPRRTRGRAHRRIVGRAKQTRLPSDMGRALLEHPQHRAEHTPGGGHLDPVVVEVRGDREVVTEQLVGAVDQVDLEGRD